MAARLLYRIGLILALALPTVSYGWPASVVGANTLCVYQGGTGGCFGTIAGAISAAANGDTIRITGGSPYFERLTINKSLSLIGDSAASTIIDGAQAGQVIHISAAVTVTLTNLTIRNGQAVSGDTPEKDGGGIHNVLGHLTLNNTVVSGNHSGMGTYGGEGGGISSLNGSLTLNNSTVSGNATGPGGSGGSGGLGGGIYNEGGPLILNHSTISGNATGNGGHGGSIGGTGGAGGGVLTQLGPATLSHSTISGNTTGDGGTGGTTGGDGGDGGGLLSFSVFLIISDSTISGNMTGAGGAGGSGPGISGSGAGLFSVKEPVTLTNSTISGNATGRGLSSSVGGDGGGIYEDRGGPVNLTHVTIGYNAVDGDKQGGAIANNAGIVNVKNSLLAFNHDSFGLDSLHDCSGALNSEGYNVMMEPDCAIAMATGDQFYVRGALLAPLANNGGPTQTNALPATSLAIDAADNATCSPTDQRGFPRPVFGGTALRCDVRAFELFRFGVRLPLVTK